jgi:hypothetical protein
MERLAQVLDEDPEFKRPGKLTVKRMIDEEKIHHLHHEEAEAARHAERDRKKVIKKDSQSAAASLFSALFAHPVELFPRTTGIRRAPACRTVLCIPYVSFG